MLTPSSYDPILQSHIGAGLAPIPIPLSPLHVIQLDEFAQVEHYQLQATLNINENYKLIQEFPYK